MDADATGNALSHRGADRLDGRKGDLGPVGDDGGHERGGAEACMRLADGAYTGHGGLVVQEHAAAAIHLNVDEAGRQKAARQIHNVRVARHIRLWQDFRHPSVIDQERVAGATNLPIEDVCPR